MLTTRIISSTVVLARPRVRLPAISEAPGVFWLALGSYLLVAAFLVFDANIIQGDALSRVGNVEYVLFSRDPHLAAIGFVWNPLPSLLMLPLLPLKVVFPQLVALGFASNIVSAAFMAGAVYQVNRLLVDLRLTRSWRWLLTVAFAVHPMIIFYGANGMSEAPFLFFLLLAVRYVASWLSSGHLKWQVYAGLALGGAYLCRYEALPAGLGTLCVIILVSWMRGPVNRERRLSTAVCDAAIVGAPLLLAVAVWAATSYIIVGHPFEQLASIYGNDSQMRTLSAGHVGGDAVQTALQLLVLEPFLVCLIALGALNAVRLRDLRGLALLGVLVPVLAFAGWARLNGTIAPWLRYFIVAIPLCTLLAGLAVAHQRQDRPSDRLLFRRLLKTSISAATAMSVLAAMAVSALAMTNPSIAPEEGHELAYLTSGGRLTADEQRAAHRFTTERAVAAYLDELHLPRGSVLVDTFIGYSIVLSSKFPNQFIITSDRDFKQAVADPGGTGVQFILVPRLNGLARLDAINQAYGGIYDSGAGIGSLAQTFPNQGDSSDWRLYRVTLTR